MSVEAKPSPLPWKMEPYHEDGDEIPAFYCVSHPGTTCAATTVCNLFSKEDAALIVRAVNCHHEMLEALKTIAAYPVASLYPDGPCIHRDDMKEIKAAIKNAEEAQPLSTHQAV